MERCLISIFCFLVFFISNIQAQEGALSGLRIYFHVYRSDTIKGAQMNIRSVRQSIKQLAFKWDKNLEGWYELNIQDSSKRFARPISLIDRNEVEEKMLLGQFHPRDAFGYLIKDIKYGIIETDSSYHASAMQCDFRLVYFNSEEVAGWSPIESYVFLVFEQSSLGKVRIKFETGNSRGIFA